MAKGKTSSGAIKPNGGPFNEQQVPAINAASTSVAAVNKARADAMPKPWTVLRDRNDIDGRS